jgi:4-hydroxy-tetrahydrodipicolinate synthase
MNLRARRQLSGVIPILAMPFSRDEEVDLEALAREVQFAEEAGVDGLGLALASEFVRLTDYERYATLNTVVATVGGRLPIVVHVGAESVQVCCERVAVATELGASAVLLPPPSFEVWTETDVHDYFERVIEACDLSIVIQDGPSAPVSIGMILALHRSHPGRIAVKSERSSSAAFIAEIVSVSNGEIPAFGGSGGLGLWAELKRGASGTMPGCAIPDLLVRVCRTARRGAWAEARREHARLLPLLQFMMLPGNMLPAHREVLRLRGILTSSVGRSPDRKLTTLEQDDLVGLLMDVRLLADDWQEDTD